MKKLSTPSQPREPREAMPESYKSIVEANSNPFDSYKALPDIQNQEPVRQEPVRQEVMRQEAVKDLPPKTLYNHNLKRLKSYRNLRKKYKLDNQKAIFLENLKETLKPLDPRSNKYDSELLVAVLDIAEYFFIYGDRDQRNAMKMEAVVELMKPYFNNDETYLLHSINNVMYRVKKSNVFRRLATRLRNFFSMMMKAS